MKLVVANKNCRVLTRTHTHAYTYNFNVVYILLTDFKRCKTINYLKKTKSIAKVCQ